MKMNVKKDRIGYAVVGLGYISQAAVLPAFAHAKKNSYLAALVSNDEKKLKQLGRKYGVRALYSYDQYEECLRSDEVDAVYIALPNDMHRDYADRAAHAGVHVLCEKPMAVTEDDCRTMLRAAEQNRVKIMIAYRLHFEKANMKAVEIVKSGKLGELRGFNSTFTMQVEKGNIRLQHEHGGGTLYDIGIYCINAARYLFRDEPIEGSAWTATGDKERFDEVEEMCSVVLRFPKERLATFLCSFGAADVSRYEVIGTKGSLAVEAAYEYAARMKMRLTIGTRTTETVFPKRDQFAPELLYFSDCVLTGRDPEPAGVEGLIDVHIIEGLYASARSGSPFKFDLATRARRPTADQVVTKPAVKKPELVHASPPSGR